MIPIKTLLRLARRMAVAWSTETLEDGLCCALSALDAHYRAVQRRLRTVRLAADHGLTLAIPQLRSTLRVSLQALQDEAAGLKRLALEPKAATPDERLLFAELRQLQDEFPSLTINWKEVFVAITTEPVTLLNVALGPFEIRLHWQGLGSDASSECFQVVALEPHPAASNERVTHPHVRDNSVCVGGAARTLRLALREGRLTDAFQIMHGVLFTYNRHSPHVPLELWGGTECTDCGLAIRADDGLTCLSCEETYCSDCADACTNCTNMHCRRCLTKCEFCRKPFCKNCLESTDHAKQACEATYRRACSSCGAVIGTRLLETGTGRCPTCRESQVTFQPTETSDEPVLQSVIHVPL